MSNNRVRVWNSVFASQVASEQPGKTEQCLFRRLLAENDLSEVELRFLVRWWRQCGFASESLSRFIERTGLLAHESDGVRASEAASSTRPTFPSMRLNCKARDCLRGSQEGHRLSSGNFRMSAFVRRFEPRACI